MGILDLKKRRNKMNHTNEIGSNWKEIRKEIFTQEEIYKSDERVASISKIIEEKMKEQQKKIRNVYKYFVCLLKEHYQILLYAYLYYIVFEFF
jgi:toxin-antitoxin system, antitoxin component, xre family